MKELSDLRIIEDIKTSHQALRLYLDSNDKLVFTLDTFVQFKEGEDERTYHYHLVDKAIEYYEDPKKFLILGGGDGLCSRNILKLIPTADITLVDYDEKVVEFCRTDKRLTKINLHSLDIGTFIYENCTEWVKNNKDLFDIIIIDLPDATSSELNKLYAYEFYEDTIKHLVPKGIISIQIHPDVLQYIGNVIENMVECLENTTFKMPWLTEGGVFIGKK